MKAQLLYMSPIILGIIPDIRGILSLSGVSELKAYDENEFSAGMRAISAEFR